MSASAVANANAAAAEPQAAQAAAADDILLLLSDDSENDNSPPQSRYAHMVNTWAHSGNTLGPTDAQTALAAVPALGSDTETFREGFKEWLAHERDSTSAARTALDKLRPQRLAAMQKFALMRAGPPAVRALARNWNNELRRTEALAQRTEAALTAAAELDHLLPELRKRLDTLRAASASLDFLSFPARPESASVLIDTFQQRPALSAETADELVCIFCRSTVAEFEGDAPPFYRVNSSCTAHASCVMRTRYCACNIAFCKPCVVRAMGYAYANQPGELHADGISRSGVQQARGAIKCPQCSEIFCFTELQPLQPRTVDAAPPAAKRSAESAPSKVRRRRRRLTRVAGDDETDSQ